MEPAETFKAGFRKPEPLPLSCFDSSGSQMKCEVLMPGLITFGNYQLVLKPAS